MSAIRLMKLKDHLQSSSLPSLLPERAITHGNMGRVAASNWELAHIRTPLEADGNIHNDEIHNVRHA
jgi:hypothetical protein